MTTAGTWGHAGVRCRIKKGWEGAGREGDALNFFNHKRLGQDWITLIWDDEEDPDCFKAAGLQIKRWEDAAFKDYEPFRQTLL